MSPLASTLAQQPSTRLQYSIHSSVALPSSSPLSSASDAPFLSQLFLDLWELCARSPSPAFSPFIASPRPADLLLPQSSHRTSSMTRRTTRARAGRANTSPSRPMPRPNTRSPPRPLALPPPQRVEEQVKMPRTLSQASISQARRSRPPPGGASAGGTARSRVSVGVHRRECQQAALEHRYFRRRGT